LLLAGRVYGMTEINLPNVGKVPVPEMGFDGVEQAEFPEGWLGVVPGELPLEMILEITGVRIDRVLQGLAGDQAGLRINDVILAINRIPSTSERIFHHEIRMKRPDSPITLKLLRDGKELELAAKLGTRPVD